MKMNSYSRQLIRQSVLIAWTLLTCASASSNASGQSDVRIERLRCESRTDPLGIGEIKPRLSWIIQSDRRGEMQSAFRVFVASSRDHLANGQADLWDSGKVDGSNNSSVVYAGKSLESGQRCHWKVMVWDKDGKPSGWSPPAVWSMGLLHPQEWQAEWIGYDAERKVEYPEADLHASKWICHPDDSSEQVPQGHRLYLARFTLPADVVLDRAEILAIADDKLWMAINGKMIVHGEPGWKKVKPVAVADVLKAGSNELRFNVRNESEGPSGLLVRLDILTNTGEEIEIVSDDSWLCSTSPGHEWPTESVNESDLKPCSVVGSYGIEPWGTAKLQDLFLPPVPLMRQEFELSKAIDSATLYVTALGNCDAYLNGERVSDEYFTPGWTDYSKRVYYRTYNVTELVQSGANALGGALSDGWFSGYIGWGRNRDHYGKSPRLKMQLHLLYQDGTSEIIGTGPKWKATAGPTREADFLMGELYDARLAQDGWDLPGFDDANWQAVDVGTQFPTEVESSPGPPVTVIEEFKPVEITEPAPGTYVFDLGQNFAGVVRLKVQGKSGQKIRLRFAERLNPDGTVYTTNLRGARTVDTYICRGSGVETWQPRFTFHGFQYVELTGLSSPPNDDTVTGIALSSDTPLAGSFECSDPSLNRLHKNILWTQYANFIDIPTDCPQRDERLGWTGDAQVYVATACLNTDVQAFFDKWLIDLKDAQRADGQFPMVAPLKVAGDDGGPAWADAGVICPWTVYEVYDDRRILERHYPSMRNFIEFCRGRSKGGLLPPDEFHCFGDWLNIDADTPKEVIYTAYFAHSVQLVAKSAEVLGFEDDAIQYQKLFEEIKSAFNDTYVTDDGRIEGATQCCYVLALSNNLLDGERKMGAAKHLVADIAKRGYHLSTGFVGTKDLMLTLASIGRNDVAYRLIHNETFPSWGFSIKQGATSIWERWDGWTPERGFQDPGMNSFAHYSFGAVYQWMAENIGGIRRLQPGYKHFEISPQPGGKLTWANVDYESIHGRISSHWKKDADAFQLDVAIPSNTTATIRLPCRDEKKLLLDDGPIGTAPDVRDLRLDGGTAIFQIGSGKYSFSTELNE